MCEILTSECEKWIWYYFNKKRGTRELVDTTVFLDVTLDNKLQWGPHLSELAIRLGSAAFAVRNITIFSDIQTARLVDFECLHSLMSYGILLWGHAADVHRNFVLQKRGIRAIYGPEPRVSLRTTPDGVVLNVVLPLPHLRDPLSTRSRNG
ncbi:hypothetical protein EVAR_31161_1 [Eumeta japonica]|uniref:Uncharacterized protein n=1 Tax=Eumeta variegata TaxID=151549 RepID=A0A4C1VVT4_EUMVA|nr:hypothetical protein EVAR_31161_1 [Eumeta japonica]